MVEQKHDWKVISDVDGTLVDTEEPSDRVMVDVLIGEWGIFKQGEEASMITLFKAGRGWLELFEEVGIDDHETRVELQVTLRSRLNARFENGVDEMPGAFELLNEFKKMGNPVGVASNSPSNVVLDRLHLSQPHPLLPLIDSNVVVGGNEAERRKPHPDIYNLAVERAGVDISRCVVFEDTPSGLTAARRAGIVNRLMISAKPYQGETEFAPTLWLPSLKEVSPYGVASLARGGKYVD